ncbi:hypothetical protein ID866_9045 [Astraeus odoratus]|nr:hypothetical protein ID866_9045 [Astraeus odoratus]
MIPFNYLFSFMLTLSTVNTSPAHSSIAKIPFVRVRDPKHTDSVHTDQLEKRDGTILVQKQYGYYCASLITSSGSTFRVAVDTGSAYTWVGAVVGKPYVYGFASRPTGATAKIAYGSSDGATFVGDTINDTIALGTLIVKDQEIGVPRELRNFPPNIDGILGLGPMRLTIGMSSDGKLIPTVVDNLYREGAIGSALLGMYFMPENVGTSGLLSFGYIRESVLTSDVRYVPVTTTIPAILFWGIDASIIYGDHTPTFLVSGSGILDTGSDKILIASDAFSVYQSATGASLYAGQLYITQDMYNELQPLAIFIGGQPYDLSPNAQIQARISPDSPIVLVVQSRRAGSGIGFSLGAPFFQHFYVVFNLGSNQIGFATHIHTDSTTN